MLLCKRMGKQRIIAETGAGQHGVATVSGALRERHTLRHCLSASCQQERLHYFKVLVLVSTTPKLAVPHAVLRVSRQTLMALLQALLAKLQTGKPSSRRRPCVTGDSLCQVRPEVHRLHGLQGEAVRLVV